MAENKIQFGASNARYALKTASGFGAWKRLPGIVTITCEPQESQSDFYADNENYFTSQGAASDQVTIEIATLPDYAKVDLLGYKEINGNLALPVNYKASEFVLGFQYEGDAVPIRVNVFGGRLVRSTETHSTKNENTEPETASYEGRFTGNRFTVEGEEEAYLYYSTNGNKDDYSTWWESVKTPGTLVTDDGDNG